MEPKTIGIGISVIGSGCGGGGVFLQPLMVLVMSGPGDGGFDVMWES